MKTNKTQLVRHGTTEHTDRDRDTAYNAINTTNQCVKVIEIAFLGRPAAEISFRIYFIKIPFFPVKEMSRL